MNHLMVPVSMQYFQMMKSQGCRTHCYITRCLSRKRHREKRICVFDLKYFLSPPPYKKLSPSGTASAFIVLTSKLWTARRLIVCSLTHAPFQSISLPPPSAPWPGCGLDSVNFACCCESSKTNPENWLTLLSPSATSQIC